MAHYLFNFVAGDAAKRPGLRDEAIGLLRARMWGIEADEPHGRALLPGDLVLIYLGAPDREFIGRAELASAVRDWAPSKAQLSPGDSPSAVLLSGSRNGVPTDERQEVLRLTDSISSIAERKGRSRSP